MRKNWGKILLFLITVLCLCVIFFYESGSDHLKDISISQTEFEQLKQNRTKSDQQLWSSIVFDDQALALDQKNACLYYSLVGAIETADNPVIHLSGKKTCKIAVRDIPVTAQSVHDNTDIPLLIYTDKSYNEYVLKCTTLPIIQIDAGNTEITRSDCSVRMSLFDNRPEASIRTITSSGTMHVRGGSSGNWPKKSYRLELNQESLGGHKRSNPRSLLGLRKDNDWILYSAYNDQEKIRNVFSTRLWEAGCAGNNALKVQNSPVYRYVEVLINGEYQGLYALGYPIDNQMWNIRSSQNEFLYKCVQWRKNEIYESPVGVSGYQLVGADTNDPACWAPLHEYYEYLDRQDPALLPMLDQASLTDLILFVELIQGSDNTEKNIYIAAKEQNGKRVYCYTPWDFDLTWGNVWLTDSPYNTAPYGRPAAKMIGFYDKNPARYLRTCDPEFADHYKNRYLELRESAWSDQNIISILDAYETDIYASGAYKRDLNCWPDGAFADPDNGLSEFKQYVLDRFGQMDAYVASCQ